MLAAEVSAEQPSVQYQKASKFYRHVHYGPLFTTQLYMQSLIDMGIQRLTSLSNLRELSLQGDPTFDGSGLTALHASSHLRVIGTLTHVANAFSRAALGIREITGYLRTPADAQTRLLHSPQAIETQLTCCLSKPSVAIAPVNIGC